MPPQRRTFVDVLTEDEKVLMEIAVRLVCALQYREKNLNSVEDAWYRKCITDELVRPSGSHYIATDTN